VYKFGGEAKIRKLPTPQQKLLGTKNDPSQNGIGIKLVMDYPIRGTISPYLMAEHTLEVYHALHLDVCSRFLIKGTKVSDQGIYIVVHLNRWKRKMVDQKQKTADMFRHQVEVPSRELTRGLAGFVINVIIASST
jgi:hypothetical protein